MMAQQVPHQSSEKKRVKVYELRNNDWFDRGTGFCVAVYHLGDDGQPKDPRVIVHSEDQPDRCILETQITKDDGFQKQQDTLIVWTEPHTGLDMALSFQEAEGCAMIWRFVNMVQQNYQGGMTGGQDDNLSDDLAIDMPNHINLPAPEMGNLTEIENAIRSLNTTGNGRDALAKYIYSESYIPKLIQLVEMAEDLESLDDLHRLCNIMKMIILLNDTTIIEQAVSDECMIGVVGALEYDPDFPTHKANHRQWLGDPGRYKEVVAIEDAMIKRKIHQTYRLQYLKDVVLARILDDPTYSVLNSLIFFNQVDIVNHLQANGQFLGELFSIFSPRNPDLKKKKDAVLFIQQCCCIAKSLQPPARQSLYNNFLANGLLGVINHGLRHPDVGVRVGATEILMNMIDHDPQMIRQTIYRQIHEKQSPLTDSLIDLLLVEVDIGAKSQISDALKVLLDHCPPPPMTQQGEVFAKGNHEVQNRTRIQGQDLQQEAFLAYFYEYSADRLFKPILDLAGRSDVNFTNQQASMFSYLIEIMIFFIRQHLQKSKLYVIERTIPQKVIKLISCKDKYLKLVSIRFFRHLVSMQDDMFSRQLIDQQVFGPLLNALSAALPRDNLMSSAGLELFEYVRKEGLRDLMKHLVESYRDKLETLSSFDTFGSMIKQYDVTQGFTMGPDNSHELEADDIARRPNAGNTKGLMEQLSVDPIEEDYFNGDDDDDDDFPRKSEKTVPPTNGGTLLSKPLVDYASDEETDDANETEMVGTPESIAMSDGKAEPHTPVQPPERLPEKRRREEDDDDEFSMLLQNKRRNSLSTSTDADHVGTALRRKKSNLSSSGDVGSSSRKIHINLGHQPSITTPPISTEERGDTQGKHPGRSLFCTSSSLDDSNAG